MTYSTIVQHTLINHLNSHRQAWYPLDAGSTRSTNSISTYLLISRAWGKAISRHWNHYDEIMTLGVEVHMYMCGIVPRTGKRDDWTIDNSFCWAMHSWTGSPAIKQQLIVLSGKRACLQHFPNAIFHWYFQNYSVKILYAIIDWEYLEISKWWIMGYSLSCPIELITDIYDIVLNLHSTG